MPLTNAEILRRLQRCNLDELSVIEEEFNLSQAYLENRTVAGRAKTILHLLKNRSDTGWMPKIKELLDQLQSGLEPYLQNRLRHLQDFLVQSPEVGNASAESAGTVKQLRERIKDGPPLRKPVLIRVRGTLYPAALLTAGWWERRQKGRNPLEIEWKSKLQRWLFEGFDLWAPSWNFCWGATDPEDPSKRYYIGQLTEGDEADSLPVIIGPKKAAKLAEHINDGWGGFEAMIVCKLGHRQQFDKKLPENARRDPQDYYLSVDDDDKRTKIDRLISTTGLYSGYLWKLLVPEEHFRDEKRLRLEHVYFIWEHTNFVASDAVAYNLDGLEHKQELIARRHPGSKLIVLQKSHAIVTPDVQPAWTVDKFYSFFLKKQIEVA